MAGSRDEPLLEPWRAVGSLSKQAGQKQALLRVTTKELQLNLSRSLLQVESELRRAAGKLHAGRDYWAGRYSASPPIAVAPTVAVPAESAAPTCVAP